MSSLIHKRYQDLNKTFFPLPPETLAIAITSKKTSVDKDSTSANTTDSSYSAVTALPSGAIHDDVETNTISIPTPEACIICLYQISQRATCCPCGHSTFDIDCLGTWLDQQQQQQQQSGQSAGCPLCRTTVSSVQYGDPDSGQIRHWSFPIAGEQDDIPKRPSQSISRRRQLWRQHESLTASAALARDPALERRREVYRKGLRSKYMGMNAYSGYRRVTAEGIRGDERLVRKARIWVRRELRVFDFLRMDSDSWSGSNSSHSHSSFGSEDSTKPAGDRDRKATNAEYLLEFIIAIIQNIEIKGSGGQAETLLGEYLGRENARLFLHELENWLQSPFDKVGEWDRAVQYDDQACVGNDEEGDWTGKGKEGGG